MFAKKVSMPNPVKNLGHIRCYSSNSPRPVKSPNNSKRYNYQLSLGDNYPIIYMFFKDFTNHRKKTNRAVVFSCRVSILKYRDHR